MKVRRAYPGMYWVGDDEEIRITRNYDARIDDERWFVYDEKLIGNALIDAVSTFAEAKQLAKSIIESD